MVASIRALSETRLLQLFLDVFLRPRLNSIIADLKSRLRFEWAYSMYIVCNNEITVMQGWTWHVNRWQFDVFSRSLFALQRSRLLLFSLAFSTTQTKHNVSSPTISRLRRAAAISALSCSRSRARLLGVVLFTICPSLNGFSRLPISKRSTWRSYGGSFLRSIRLSSRASIKVSNPTSTLLAKVFLSPCILFHFILI